MYFTLDLYFDLCLCVRVVVSTISDLVTACTSQGNATASSVLFDVLPASILRPLAACLAPSDLDVDDDVVTDALAVLIQLASYLSANIPAHSVATADVDEIPAPTVDALLSG